MRMCSARIRVVGTADIGHDGDGDDSGSQTKPGQGGWFEPDVREPMAFKEALKARVHAVLKCFVSLEGQEPIKLGIHEAGYR